LWQAIHWRWVLANCCNLNHLLIFIAAEAAPIPQAAGLFVGASSLAMSLANCCNLNHLLIFIAAEAAPTAKVTGL
jgi:hypothetical protein